MMTGRETEADLGGMNMGLCAKSINYHSLDMGTRWQGAKKKIKTERNMK